MGVAPASAGAAAVGPLFLGRHSAANVQPDMRAGRPRAPSAFAGSRGATAANSPRRPASPRRCTTACTASGAAGARQCARAEGWRVCSLAGWLAASRRPAFEKAPRAGGLAGRHPCAELRARRARIRTAKYLIYAPILRGEAAQRFASRARRAVSVQHVDGSVGWYLGWCCTGRGPLLDGWIDGHAMRHCYRERLTKSRLAVPPSWDAPGAGQAYQSTAARRANGVPGTPLRLRAPPCPGRLSVR